jgi:hypothetical protein
MKYLHIIICFQHSKKACGVIILKDYVDYSGTPKLINKNGVDLILTGWAVKSGQRFPIYLQLTGMSLAKQKFALSTGLYSIKNNYGYTLEMA